MNPRNLEHQASAIRHLLNGGEITPEIRECAEAGVKSLDWMAKGELVLKELIRLRKEEPELFEAFRRLVSGGAKISDIRETETLEEEMGL